MSHVLIGTLAADFASAVADKLELRTALKRASDLTFVVAAVGRTSVVAVTSWAVASSVAVTAS